MPVRVGACAGRPLLSPLDLPPRCPAASGFDRLRPFSFDDQTIAIG